MLAPLHASWLADVSAIEIEPSVDRATPLLFAAITWFSVGGHVNGGIRGIIRAEARDDEAANNLRDVMRGFMALAKMQSGSKPELQAMMQSLGLGGKGKTVELSFTVPAEVFDVIGAAASHAVKPQGH